MPDFRNRVPTTLSQLGSLVLLSLIIVGCAPIGPSVTYNAWECGEATAETTQSTCSLIPSNRYYAVIGSYSGEVQPINYAEAIPHGRGKITVGNQLIDAEFTMGDISNIKLSSPDLWSFNGQVRDDLTWYAGEYETKTFKFNGRFNDTMRPKRGTFTSKVSGDRFNGELNYIRGRPVPKSGILEKRIGDCNITSSGQFTLNDSDKLVIDPWGKFYVQHPAGKVSGRFEGDRVDSSLIEISSPTTEKLTLNSLGFGLRDGFLDEIFTTERFLYKSSSDNEVSWVQLKWKSLQDCGSAAKLEKVGTFLSAVPSRLMITDTYIPSSQNTKFKFLNTNSIDYTPEQLLLVKYTDKTSERKITERFEEKSEYVSGTRQVYNSRYDVVQAAVYDAQSKLTQARAKDDARWANNPCQGSIFQCALADAFLDETPDAQKVYDQAVSQLSQTPRMLTQKIHSDYEVEKLKVKTDKKSTLVFAFFDFETGATYREKITLKDSKRFELVSSPVAETDVKKRQLLDGTSSESEVDTWLDENIRYKFDLETLLLDLKTPENKLKLAKVDQMAYAKRLNSGDSSLKTPRVMSTPKVVQSPKKIKPYVLEDSILVVERLDSMGSGFYVEENHILTNQHVIEGSTYLDLRTFSGETFSGRVIAKDIATDLALLKVNRAGVPLKLEDSCKVDRRESVFTIGHPKGFEYSTSRGIVSAIRNMRHPFYPESGIIKRYIQIDAAISPGNSGGPLFNAAENVIGINTWGRTDGQSLNFAVHCSEIKTFLRETNLIE
jgi:S1-C subfamily serine protease